MAETLSVDLKVTGVGTLRNEAVGVATGRIETGRNGFPDLLLSLHNPAQQSNDEDYADVQLSGSVTVAKDATETIDLSTVEDDFGNTHKLALVKLVVFAIEDPDADTVVRVGPQSYDGACLLGMTVEDGVTPDYHAAVTFDNFIVFSSLAGFDPEDGYLPVTNKSAVTGDVVVKWWLVGNEDV